MKRSRRSCTIEDLPEDVLIDILSRLSIKTIVTCRCVSKTWYNLSSNPHFTKLHFTRSPVQFINTRTKGTTFSLSLVELDDETDLDNIIKPILSKFRLSRCYMDVINSCNGFLCLAQLENHFCPFTICNPITGEYLNLPKHKMYDFSDESVVSGFGFCGKTNQYKVVRLVPISKNGGFKDYDDIDTRVVEIYTIGTKSWRTIGTAPEYPVASYCTTYFNGKIHWVSDDFDSSDFIITFDLESETFGSVPPPPHFSVESIMERRYEITIGVLGEFLSISYNRELWVMKEYGSWTKVGVDRIHNPYPRQPIKYLRGGKILMNYDDRKLISFDPVKEISRKFEVPQCSQRLETIAHVPSFMSFNDAMMGAKGVKLSTGMCRVVLRKR